MLKNKTFWKSALACALITLLAIGSTVSAAENTTPESIIYEGRLLNSAGQPIQSAQTLRFSLWQSADLVSADITEAGEISITAPNYGGWTETHTLTPSETGIFSVKLGSISPLPSMDFATHKYLQVEVKSEAASNTDYETLDSNSTDEAIDRQAIGSIPYAKNADQLDNYEVGTSSGEIAILGQNGQWASTQIPGATDADTFILDKNDNATGEIKLQFGETLNKYLSYDPTNSYFNFNDTVQIQGDLIVTGLIRGLIQSGTGFHSQDTDMGTHEEDFILNMSGSQVVLSSSGVTANRTITFDDADTKVVGENNAQTLTNKTISGDQNTLNNIDWSSMKARSKSILLAPAYPSYVISDAQANNLATLNLGNDQINNHQYFMLTSAQATLNGLDIYVEVSIPQDFVSWETNPLQIQLKSDSALATDNQLDIYMQDTNNQAVSLTDSQDLAGSVANTWVAKNIGFSGSPTWTPGGIMRLRLHLQAKDNNSLYIGEIILNYNGK
ncbi:MAG: hypothetical protein NTZ80_01655 [Patescibacteria group bacterium]|nr:hypothetical protein [Patescibacteria group bacterium]